MEHEAVTGGLVGGDLLPVQLHHLLDEVCRLGLVVPQQLVEHLQDSICHLPLNGRRVAEDGIKQHQVAEEMGHF